MEKPVQSGDIYELHARLCQILLGSQSIKIICHDFNTLTSNYDRVNFAKTLLDKYKIKVEHLDIPIKDDKVALKFREQGNELFKRKNDKDAWEMYTRSIAHSKEKSECLGLAFANRSAVLFQKGLFKECLIDISYALENNYPENILKKILLRKEKCEQLLKQQKPSQFYSKLPSLEFINEMIDCASDRISISCNESYGRYVVAEKNIIPGEVLAIEKPYTKILLQGFCYTHCHNCVKPSMNLIPCAHCNLALFCSLSCKEHAWESFHKYECPILHILYYLDVNKLTLVALRISIVARNDYKFVDSFQRKISQQNYYYKSACYENVHNLIANTEKRQTNDLFERAVIAAIIYDLIESHTSFFEDMPDRETGENMFKELLLLHIQTAPSNFHEISELQISNGKSDTVEIGCGVYSFMSLLNHACSPNIVRICHGSNIVLRALMPIAKGEQLFDNYGYHHCLMPKEERKKILLKQYYFNCECFACIYNWPLYHNLKEEGKDLEVSTEEISALQEGDISIANKVTPIMCNKIEELSHFEPCKELSDAQEILKQCLKIFGNRIVLM